MPGGKVVMVVGNRKRKKNVVLLEDFDRVVPMVVTPSNQHSAPKNYIDIRPLRSMVSP